MAAPDPSDDITRLIRLWGAGDRSAGERLFELVLPELREIAGRLMRRERADHTLQPTALVNEIYFRLARARELDWHDRKHFFAIAARAMRHCLIDHSRSHPDVVFEPVEDVAFKLAGVRIDPDFQLGLGLLVEELSKEHPELATIVEYKYYLGLTDEETAEITGLGVRTVKRRWKDARDWLFERLNGVKGAGQS